MSKKKRFPPEQKKRGHDLWAGPPNKCLLSIHIKYAPIYIHKAGSMCLLPIITFASPQVVIMRCLKCLSIRCCVVFDIELVIFPS